MKRQKIIKFWIFLLIFAFFAPMIGGNNLIAHATNEEMKITSKSAILVDYNSEKVIYEKEANKRLPIASLTKLATLAIVFDYLNKGIIKENDLVCVSDNAGNTGGSSAFLDAGSSYKVSELIKSVVIASANDSAVALAEFVAGNEESFVQKMNKLVSNLGLMDTHFENVTGLPVDNHYSSASDMVKIYKLACENVLYKKYSKIWIEDFIHPSGRKTELVNTNRLIKTYDGIDGGKTGYTNKAKFCLTASASRGQTRLIGVIIGSDDSKTRFAEMSKLFNYGFANYETKMLINNDSPVAVYKFKNALNQVSIFPEKEISVFLRKNEQFDFSTDYEIYDNIKAPIKQGDVVGKMFVFDKNNLVVDEVNLISGGSTGEVGLREKLDLIVKKW